MAHSFRFVVDVTVDRVQGKFAARDEIADELRQAIEDANPDSVDGVGADGDSEYEVTDWSVNDE